MGGYGSMAREAAFTSTESCLTVRGGLSVEFNRMAGVYIDTSGSSHYEVRIPYVSDEELNFLGRKTKRIKEIVVPDLDTETARELFSLLRRHQVRVANLTKETFPEP